MQNILVVEDDYDLNQAICYSLKKSGYGVYGVTSVSYTHLSTPEEAKSNLQGVWVCFSVFLTDVCCLSAISVT